MGVRFRSLVLRSTVLLVACGTPYGTGGSSESPTTGDDAGSNGVEAGANQTDGGGHDAGASDASDASTSVYMDAVGADAPIAYWRMNATHGTEVPDEASGNNLHFGGSGHQLGVPGATSDGDFAIGFDGISSSLLPIGTPFEFVGTKPYSIECWINPVGTSLNPEVVVGRTLAGRGYRLYTQGTQLIATRADADGGSTSATTSITANVFQHVVVVFDGAIQTLFVDGVKRANSVSAASLGSAMAPFGVGGDVDKDSSYFSGIIDEVAIYDHPLSEARVLAHFQAARQ